LFVVLFWIAVFLIVMRLLTWVAKNHPNARNTAAAVVEFGAAFAIANALTLTAVASGSQAPSAALVVKAVLFALIGAVAHYFASNTARSPLVVGVPFVLVGVAVLVGVLNPPWRSLVGTALIVLGAILGWLKSREGRGPARPKESGDAAQAFYDAPAVKPSDRS